MRRPSGRIPGRVEWGPCGGSTNSFDGAIDDIRIFNYALDPWEVTNLNYVGQLRGVRVKTWVEIQ